MKKYRDLPLQKHTLNLYRGELDDLAALFPDIPKSVVVRYLVHDTIERHAAAAPKAEVKNVEVQL